MKNRRELLERCRFTGSRAIVSLLRKHTPLFCELIRLSCAPRMLQRIPKMNMRTVCMWSHHSQTLMHFGFEEHKLHLILKKRGKKNLHLMHSITLQHYKMIFMRKTQLSLGKIIY